MKKFWKWMENKYEVDMDACIEPQIKDSLSTYCFPTKQMLIGYMIEYLFEFGKFYGPSNKCLSNNDIIRYYYELKNYIMEVK